MGTSGHGAVVDSGRLVAAIVGVLLLACFRQPNDEQASARAVKAAIEGDLGGIVNVRIEPPPLAIVRVRFESPPRDMVCPPAAPESWFTEKRALLIGRVESVVRSVIQPTPPVVEVSTPSQWNHALRSHRVRQLAEKALECPTVLLEIGIGENRFRALGCGREVTYLASCDGGPGPEGWSCEFTREGVPPAAQ